MRQVSKPLNASLVTRAVVMGGLPPSFHMVHILLSAVSYRLKPTNRARRIRE